MTHHLLYNVEPVVAIIPATMTAATHSGIAIDGTGYDRAAFIMMTGSGAGAGFQRSPDGSHSPGACRLTPAARAWQALP